MTARHVLLSVQRQNLTHYTKDQWSIVNILLVSNGIVLQPVPGSCKMRPTFAPDL
jgi:hypothetical protein